MSATDSALRRRFRTFKPEGPLLTEHPANGGPRSAVAPASDSDDADDADDAAAADSDADADSTDDAPVPRSAAHAAAESEGDWLAVYVLVGFLVAFAAGVGLPSVAPVSGRAISIAGLAATLLGVSATIFAPGGLTKFMTTTIFVAAGGLGLVVGGLVGNTVVMTL